jgi:predicted outer membrane repeat protein
VDDDTGEIEDGTAEYPLGKIQSGIDVVAANGTVIVNPGTYYENINFNGRNITLTGTDPNDPCTVASTIIDGNQADTVVTFSSSENAGSLLKGFTITNGYSEWDGGGIYCEHSSPAITRCIIRNNTSAMGGGGIKCYDRSGAAITYCSITANRAGESQSGGGISCWNDSNAVISYCNISDNNCGYGGAGMYINTSRPELTDCTFSGNFMTDQYTYGGAINIYDSSPKITGCSFINNRASWEAGGVYNNWNCSPVLINCTFVNNIAGESGGAMSNSSSAMPKLINCSFLGNRAGNRGGAIYSYYSNLALKMTNCRFAGNVVTKTGSDGGAIYNDGSGPTITNCTFSDNFAKDKGGAIYNSFNNYGTNGNMSAANCIFWGNLGTGQIYDYLSTTQITYSDVQNGWTGAGNINNDPLFIASGHWVDVNDTNTVVEPNASNALWLNGDYHLEYNSGCIDAGSNNKVPADTYDIDGDANTSEPLPQDLDRRPRIKDGDCNSTQIVDMGAYEFNWVYLGDFDYDCNIDFVDYAVLASSWLENNPLADIAPPPAGNGIVDISDLAILCDNWLTGI